MTCNSVNDLPMVLKIRDDVSDPKSKKRIFCRPYIHLSNTPMFISARYMEISEVVEGTIVDEPQIIIEADFNKDGQIHNCIMTRHCVLGKDAMKEIDQKRVSRNPNGYHFIPIEAISQEYWNKFILPMCVQFEGKKVFIQNEDANRSIVDAVILKNGDTRYDKHLYFEVEADKPETAMIVFVCDTNSQREFEQEEDKRSEEYQYNKLNYIQFYGCKPIGEFVEHIDHEKVKIHTEGYLCIQGSAVASHVWNQLLRSIS